MSLPKWINHSVDAFVEMLAMVDHYVFGHDYDLPVTDVGAERLAELEQEREAWEANELFDRTCTTGCECGAGYGGECLAEADQSPGQGQCSDFPCSPGCQSWGCEAVNARDDSAAESSPLAGVQRAASPEGVSDETPDTPPPSGRTDAELLLAAAAVIEMDGADMLTELAADLRQRASLCESVRISVDHADLAERITATRAAWMERQRLGFPEPTPHEIAADLLANYYITEK